MPSSPLALYIHWPFCKSKCPYCDFNSHVRESIEYPEWELSYKRELDYFSNYLKDKEINSIFLGGGTPSLMPPDLVSSLLDHVAGLCTIAPNVEITLEANPTSSEGKRFHDFKSAGINRLSMGIQALNDQDLKALGREHTAKEAIETIKLAARIFDNYSFDLIYARPDQTLAQWKQELTDAIALGNNHLSLYQLTIEKGTEFFRQYQKGFLDIPSNQLAADLYALTQEITHKHNLPAYEISNHATNGSECLHNINYWKYHEYLGIGPGAHSRVRFDGKTMQALMMRHAPEVWMKQVNEKGHGIQTQTSLTEQEIVEEILLMGLRLTDGIDLSYHDHLLTKPLVSYIAPSKIQQLVDANYIDKNDAMLRATKSGRLVLNTLLSHLLSSET